MTISHDVAHIILMGKTYACLKTPRHLIQPFCDAACIDLSGILLLTFAALHNSRLLVVSGFNSSRKRKRCIRSYKPHHFSHYPTYLMIVIFKDGIGRIFSLRDKGRFKKARFNPSFIQGNGCYSYPQ